MPRRQMFVLSLGLVVCVLSLVLPDWAAAQGRKDAQESLDGLTRSWSNHLPADQRFVELAAFRYEAILDRNTGLVWEKSPIAVPNWAAGLSRCITANIGGLKGWRLPSIPELASLVDPQYSYPALPPQHPFNTVSVVGFFSSASTDVEDPALVWGVTVLGTGAVVKTFKTGPSNVWCVRGGSNPNPR